MKPRLAPFIVLLAGVAHGANVETVPASVAVPSIARSATQTPPFDPETVLTNKGLAPSAISFEIEVTRASIVEGGGAQQPARLRLQTINNGETAALFGFKPAQVGRWEVATSYVFANRQGDGLGTLSYLIGARLIDHLFDGSLSSHPDDREQDASVVWMRLIAAGLARHHDEPDGRIVDVVDRPALRAASEKAHAFFLQRLRNPQELSRP